MRSCIAGTIVVANEDAATAASKDQRGAEAGRAGPNDDYVIGRRSGRHQSRLSTFPHCILKLSNVTVAEAVVVWLVTARPTSTEVLIGIVSVPTSDHVAPSLDS